MLSCVIHIDVIKVSIESSDIFSYSFLPDDAMHKRGLCRNAVSVCVCVCKIRGSCQNE